MLEDIKDVYDLGYDKNLYKGDSELAAGILEPLTSLETSLTGGVSSSLVADGDLGQILFSGKTSFTDTTEGMYQGIDSDGLFKWVMGGDTNSIDWSVTTEGVLTVTGTISASTIIGGEIHIPDEDTTTASFHVNTSGTAWWGATETEFTASVTNAEAYITAAGVAVFQIATIGGSSLVGGFTVNDATIYALLSGTPTAVPVDGLSFYSGSAARVVIFEGSAERVRLGYLSAGVYGILGYATNGTTKLFELSDTQNWIAGWTISSTTFANGTSVILDASNSAISLNNATFGTDGIQLEYNAGNPRAYIGNGTTYFFNFDGTNISWGAVNTTLSTAGLLTTISALIGGWNVVDGYIYNLQSGTPIASPNDGLVLASGNEAMTVYEDTAIRTINGYLSAGVYGFRAYATDGSTIIFEMSDTQQRIAGWYFTDTLLRSGTTDANSNVLIDSANSLIRLGPTTGDYITIDGANRRIRSSDYVSGAFGAGFTLEPDLLEVGNASIRGRIQMATFVANSISAVNGDIVVAIGSDTLDADMSALDASTLTITGDMTLAVNDRIRIKAFVDDEWMVVTNIASAPTYSVTRDNASAYAANSNPAWTKGSTVVNFGPSGSGGVFITANDTNAPFVSVFTHAGSPWSALTTRLRLGNLNGYLGYVADIYGLGVGSSTAGEANITIEPTNGLRIRSGTTTLFQVDMSGSATIGGWILGATSLTDAAGVVGISSAVTGGDDIRFFAGDATPASAEFRVYESGALVASSATITGAITATSGDIGGWVVIAGYLYNLGSGTPTSTPTDGIVLASGNEALIVYEGTAKRVEVGYLSAGVYGLKTFATNGTTVVFEVSDTRQFLSGFTLTDTDLAVSTNIILDASAKAISINDATFGNSGIQLQYNAGTPRSYVGDGSNNFAKFDGMTFSSSGSLVAQVAVTSGEALNVGDHLAYSAVSTVVRYSPTALPTTFDQSAELLGLFIYGNASQAGRFIKLSTTISAFIFSDSNGPYATCARIPITPSTGAIGTIVAASSLATAVGTPVTIDAVYIDATTILTCSSVGNNFRAGVIDLTSTITTGTTVTIDTTDVITGFCDYLSDSHVLFFSVVVTSGNIQFHKYTRSGTTLTSSSSGTVTTLFAGDTFNLKGVRRWNGTDYFLIIVQNDTDLVAQALIVHYDTVGSTFDVVGSVVNFSGGQDLLNTNGSAAVWADLSSTAMLVACPTSTTAGMYFVVSRSSATSTVPVIGTMNAMTARGANSGYCLTKVNAICAFLTTTSVAVTTVQLLELNSAGTDAVVRITVTPGTPTGAGTAASDYITAAFQASPTRYGYFEIDTGTDIQVGTAPATLPPPLGIGRSTVATSTALTVISGGPASSLVTLTATQKYYADWGGQLTTESNGTPDKVGVTDSTTLLIVKSW